MLNQIVMEIIKNGILIKSDETIEFVKPPVYEVIRIIDGIPLYFEGHITRLFQSLEITHLKCSLTAVDLLGYIKLLTQETGVANNNIRLEIGEDATGHTVWILFWVSSFYPAKEIYSSGVKTITSKFTRQNPHAKVYLSEFVKDVNALKTKANAFEVILVKEDGTVTEGSRSNLFFIKEGKLYSASEKDVLMGITRQKMLKLLKNMSVEFIEKDINIETIGSFEACFLTGTSIHLLPVNEIDDIKFASSTHPVFLELMRAFELIVKEDLEHTRRLK